MNPLGAPGAPPAEPPARSRGATLRLAGLLVGGAGLLQLVLWFRSVELFSVARFAVLVLLGPVVRLAGGASDSLTLMIGSSYLSFAIDVLAAIAAVLALVSLATGGVVPRRAVVVAGAALAVHVVGALLLSVPAVFSAVPSQEVLIALSIIGSLAETFSLIAVGIVWFLAGRALR